MPRVSVIIPTYNRRALVQGAIDSVLFLQKREVRKMSKSVKWITFITLVSMAVSIVSLTCPEIAHSQKPEVHWSVQSISPPGEAGTTPDITADSAGNLHVVWLSRPGQDTSRPATDVLYARYDGKTWTTPNSVLAISGGYTPRVAIDRYGWLHMTLGIGQTLMYTRAHSSEADNAHNWMPPKPISSIAFFGSQAFLLDSTGVLHVVYQSFNDSTLEYIRSSDGGDSWSGPTILAEETGSDDRPALPDLIEDQQGILHLVWSMTQAPSYYGGEGVYYMRSTDRGLSWSVPQRLDSYADGQNDNAWLASIKEIAPNTLVVVWDRHARTGLRTFTLSNDGGGQWESPRPVPGNITLQTGLNPILKDGAGNVFLFNAGTAPGLEGAGEHVIFQRWEENTWGSMQSIFNDPGAHYLRGVVTYGNVLNLVWGSLSGYRGTIFYARGVTDALFQLGKPVPTVQPSASVTPTTAFPTQTPRPSPTRFPTSSERATEDVVVSDSRMLQTLILSLLPVVLVILAVILVRRRR